MRLRNRAGSALVGVLWAAAVLGVVVVGLLHAQRIELRLAKNGLDSLQAHYLALAGVEKARALLFHELRDLKQSGETRSRLLDSPQDFREVPLGRGRFRIVRGRERDEGPGPLIHGVRDEGARLPINSTGLEELKRLHGVSETLAAAVVDFIDGDDRPSPQGAEAEDYASLSPPTLPRNGSLWSLGELLRVLGMTPQLLHGEDRNLNGLLDPEEDDGPVSAPLDDGNGALDTGLSGLLTLDTAVENLSLRGKDRLDLKTASAEDLATLDGVSADLAKAVVTYRGERQFESVVDLLQVTAPRPQGQAAPPAQPPPPAAPGADGGGGAPAGKSAPPPPAPAPAQGGGEKLVSVDLLKRIADEVTVGPDRELRGAVNVNTAPAEVLVALPGMNEDLARAVVDHRRSRGLFESPAGLLDVPGMTTDIFKGLAGRVALRSETFRVLSEGLLPATGARRRIAAVVQVSAFDAEVLSFREEP